MKKRIIREFSKAGMATGLVLCFDGIKTGNSFKSFSGCALAFASGIIDVTALTLCSDEEGMGIIVGAGDATEAALVGYAASEAINGNMSIPNAAITASIGMGIGRITDGIQLIKGLKNKISEKFNSRESNQKPL